jgi:diacylglycerol O-acyltransferase
LYGLGRQVEELLPYVPIADRVRIGVAMFSYRDKLSFGITGDYTTVPDIEVLAAGIRTAMDRLLAARRPA